MKREDAVEVTDFKDPPDACFGHDQHEVAVEQANPLERPDKDPDTEAVDEVDPAEVEDETPLALLDRLHHRLPQFGRADDIEFAGHGQHGPVALGVGVHNNLHTGDGIGPQPCDSVTPLP